MRFRVFAAAAATLLLACSAQAATGPKGGPSDSWTRMQKFEFYVGELAGALNLCRITDLAYELKELSDMTPYGRKGWRSMLPFDSISGGRCTSYAESAREILADRDKLVAYLADKYDCPGGDCAEEGGGEAASRPCQTELDAHLSSLPLATNDVSAIRMVTKEPGVNERFRGNYKHQAWVTLKSCSGGLLVQLTESCQPRKTFSRGDCQVEGISSY